MSQFLYNVTVAVSEAAQQEWLDWMRTTHIPRVLATGLFSHARLVRVHAFERDALTYAVQYLTESRESYDRFISDHAPALDAEHLKRFGDLATPFATLLEVLDTFSPASH